MLIEAARSSPRPSRWRAWPAPIAVALLMHGWLLSGDALSVGVEDVRIASPTAMQVRRIEAPSPSPARVDAVLLPPPAPPRARAVPAVQRVPPPVRAAEPAEVVAAAPVPIEPAEPAAALPPDPVIVASLGAEIVKTAAAAPAPSGDEPLPVYRTVMPPPATLRYQLRRGMFSGSGELVWKPAGERYEVRLEGSVAGLHVLTETSTGSVDAHGLAPLRYTDARIRRGVSAANFQRDKGKITYSGPQVEFPLPAGAQDRVSWMIQIAGVLNAAPQLAAPGGRIVFFVTGARGDADSWVFRYVGTESIQADGGMVRAVKFTREPRRAYDRLVEVWLAPAHHHLPVRAKLTATADGEIFELLLRDIQSP